MRKTIIWLFVFFAVIWSASNGVAREIHVSVSGDDANNGSPAKPYKTISAAARAAYPGDTITVHSGVYRERVNPPRGGDSDDKRIVYQAAPGDTVEIKGSEVIKQWEKVQGNTWKVVIPNSFFGGYNPYSDTIHGDWFDPKGREHHTGAVYLNGDWLMEAANLDEVLDTSGKPPAWLRQNYFSELLQRGGNTRSLKDLKSEKTWLWYAAVDKENTTIWAQFKGVNPNEQTVEINVRKTVFYPEKTGINYITVRGFTLRDAATQWAPPTAEQPGIIGTNWSKGWIIEDNTISHSVCSCVSLGKHGDAFDNTSADTAEGYVKTIDRAIQRGWSKENIGHHIVRNNTISHCEQTGIVGSLGAVFSTISGNTIHDIHVRRFFSGAEMAGIKLHAAIDVVITGNHIYRTCLGTWLDWMAQGTRVSGNLYHDNYGPDLFVEVDHGPFVVDNNIFLSPTTLLSISQGGAIVHNLISGRIDIIPYDARMTPYHMPHSTELAGMHDNPLGDVRYYNNIFTGGANLKPYDDAKLPMWMNGNVFVFGAIPSAWETDPVRKPDFNPDLKLIERNDGYYLEFTFDAAWRRDRQRRLVDSELLGRAAIPDAPFEQPDGTPLRIDTDYFRNARDAANPTPGPFEDPGDGRITIKVWPKSSK